MVHVCDHTLHIAAAPDNRVSIVQDGKGDHLHRKGGRKRWVNISERMAFAARLM